MGIASEIDAALRLGDPPGGDRVRGEVTLPPDFLGFSGHFPDRALVPAVCQIEVVRSLLERSLGGRWVLRRILNAKFHRPILACETVSVEAEHGVTEGALRVKAVLSVAGERRSSMDLELAGDA